MVVPCIIITCVVFSVVFFFFGFRTLTRNIRERRGEKVQMNMPGKYMYIYCIGLIGM